MIDKIGQILVLVLCVGSLYASYLQSGWYGLVVSVAIIGCIYFAAKVGVLCK